MKIKLIVKSFMILKKLIYVSCFSISATVIQQKKREVMNYKMLWRFSLRLSYLSEN